MNMDIDYIIVILFTTSVERSWYSGLGYKILKAESQKETGFYHDESSVY